MAKVSGWCSGRLECFNQMRSPGIRMKYDSFFSNCAEYLEKIVAKIELVSILCLERAWAMVHWSHCVATMCEHGTVKCDSVAFWLRRHFFLACVSSWSSCRFSILCCRWSTLQPQLAAHTVVVLPHVRSEHPHSMVGDLEREWWVFSRSPSFYHIFPHIQSFSLFFLPFSRFPFFSLLLVSTFSHFFNLFLFQPFFHTLSTVFWSRRRDVLASLFWTRHLPHTHDTDTNVSNAACFCAFSVARRVHTSTWLLFIRLIRTLAFFSGKSDDSQMRETKNFHLRGSYLGENSF